MKKIVSLLLAFAFVILSACACAESLVVGSCAGTASLESFRTLLSQTSAEARFSCTWDEEPDTVEDYEIYTVHVDGTEFSLQIYVTGGAVSFIAGVASKFNVNSQEDAALLGTWFGASLRAVICALCTAEGGNPDIASITEGIITAMEDLISYMRDNDKLQAGAASVITVEGHPVGFELSGTSVNIPAVLNLRFVITSPDGILETAE